DQRSPFKGDMTNDGEVRFALDVESLASVCNDGCVVFRQRDRDDNIATAILLVGNPTAQRKICKVKTTCNKMFIIRPAVFDLEAYSELAVKITYVPTSDAFGKQRENQWFAIHYITSTDDSKSPQECWANNGAQADTVKRLRARFEKVKKGTVERNKDVGITSLNEALQRGVYSKSNETTLRCVPSDVVLFTPAYNEREKEKRLFTTISFINCTKVRRAVQVFCPLDPHVNKYHVEMFVVDPDMQYNLTMRFLPSKKFRQQAKIDIPYITVAHIEASDPSNTAEQVWSQFKKRPNARCIIKKIPIHFDDTKLENLRNGHVIDEEGTMTARDTDKNENVIQCSDEHSDQDRRKEESERSQKVRNGLTVGKSILEGNAEDNSNSTNYGSESNTGMDSDESDRGTKISDERI
uniref:Major sperm protein n=1 Tax=Parascaris univalens TaxID=6257 RepID=A0A914ZSQ9_PARUN